jgi:nucleotide-binding universal stress UspA family protein
MTDTVHACPRCELRFNRPVELVDHIRRDHPAPVEGDPTPHGRVLVAVDPARAAPTEALMTAEMLATQLQAALEVVAATPPGLTAATTQAYLQERARRARKAGLPWVSWHDLGAGPAAAAVVAHAAGTPHTYLCLSSRSRTAVGEKIFGSVAEQILRTSTVPVVVTGPQAAPMGEPFSRVVVCVDRAGSAPSVIAAAGELARRLDVRLIAVEVAIPDVTGEPIGDDSHLRSLTEGAAPEVTVHLLAGHQPWAPILAFVRDDPSTVLVTGRRPVHSPGRFVAGSVAINLARTALGPVMVVPQSETR